MLAEKLASELAVGSVNIGRFLRLCYTLCEASPNNASVTQAPVECTSVNQALGHLFGRAFLVPNFFSFARKPWSDELMTSQEFLEQLAEKMAWNIDEVSETAVLSELGLWDSMAVLGFIAAADKSLGINPSPDAIVGAKTVGDLLATVSEGLSDR